MVTPLLPLRNPILCILNVCSTAQKCPHVVDYVWRHHRKCYPNFDWEIVLDRPECQISDVTYIILNASWSHFIVLPEWNTMLTAKLCSHTALGKTNSNMLRLNVHVVTQGDEMTQLWFFCLLSLLSSLFSIKSCQALNMWLWSSKLQHSLRSWPNDA